MTTYSVFRNDHLDRDHVRTDHDLAALDPRPSEVGASHSQKVALLLRRWSMRGY